MKKLKIFQITLILLFIIFLIFFFKSVNYTKEYVVNDIKIIETYNKDDDYYYFTFTYKDKTLDYLYESSYKRNRNFIENMKVIEEEEDFCLIPEGNTLEFIPLCMEDNAITYYKKVNKNLKKQIPEEYLKEEQELNETFKDINIYNRDFTYLLWNYNGFYYINNDEEKEIKLFDSETYNVNLVAYTKDYLVIADYDNSYTFDKIYRITLSNGDLKEYDLDRNIYFDSYFPGYEKNKLYIVDNKEEMMYELNVKNGDLEKIKAKMYKNGKWEEVGIKSLINTNKEFTYKTNYSYTLEDGTLFLNYQTSEKKTKIDDSVTTIVRIKDNLVFYLKTDTLYVFNPLKGSTKLLEFFEWNFNYDNMIYVD